MTHDYFFQLIGGGRKITSSSMEEEIKAWIRGLREKKARVTRGMIIEKVKYISQSCENDDCSISFVASDGWLWSFMSRHGLSLRRKTTTAQKLPEAVIPKVVNFIMYVRNLRKLHGYPFSIKHSGNGRNCCLDRHGW